jgi:hypothetical protein
MPRIRSIKPEFFLNEDLATLPYQARLLFIGLWTHADRGGRLEDRPKRLTIQLFPYDKKLDLDAELTRLADGGFIIRYAADGERYIAIPKFAKHQHFHRDEKQSSRPAPGQHGADTVPAPGEHGGSTPVICNLRSEIGDLKSEICSLPVIRRETEFTEFWSAYPRKVGKGAAERVWQKERPPLAAVLTALAWQRYDPEWLKDRGQFIPHPATYLKAHRWEDEPNTAPAVSEATAHNLATGSAWLRRSHDRD